VRHSEEVTTVDEKRSSLSGSKGQPGREETRERLLAIVEAVHGSIVEHSRVTGEQLSKEALAPVVERALDEYLTGEDVILASKSKRDAIQGVIDEILGFGPIQDLLNDNDVTEIMVNGPFKLYVEKRGKLLSVPNIFRNDQHVLRIIDKIVAPLGRRIDEASPMVDARLPDGSRVNAVIPPLSLRGPTLTIRKFARIPYTAADLVTFGTITQKMLDFLECCVKSRHNILISGGTGSGKTTTLNVLSSLIPHDERIITIEDAAELQLQQEHIVTLESRPANLEGKGEVSIRQLVRNALRMRPDRIVVGEVRGGEALDMLQAMNTGHDGSLTTAHTNNPRDALSRIETMVLMAGADLPVRAIREQIAAALDIIVHQSRLSDGSRRVTHITEVQGMESDNIVLQDIFVFKQEGVAEDGHVLGAHASTGLRPRSLERFKQYGINFPMPMG
jgi:pilus assembly protein CpaF